MTASVDFGRYLNIRSAYTPAWISNDQCIAFLTDITGVPQVWSVGVEGGWPDQLTFFQDKVWTLNASPSGNSLICSRDMGGNENYQLYLVSGDGSDIHRLTHNDDAIHRFGGWSGDGKHIAYSGNERNGRDFDIYILNAEGGEPELVFQSNGNYHPLTWSPDHSKLITTHEISSASQPLYLLDLSTRQIHPLTDKKSPARYEHVRWTPDGRIYLITNQDREYMNPAKLNVDTREITYLSDHDWDVEYLDVSPDGEALAYILNENGYGKLCILGIPGGKLEYVNDLPEGIVAEPVFSKSGRDISVSFQSPGNNLDIWIVNRNTLTGRKLTQSTLAGICRSSLREPELIHYKTFDGRDIPGFYFRPEHGSSPHPVILYVHGGPASQLRPDFDPRFQYFLTCGYAILATNVRGSSGYGKTYMALDDVHKRMDSVTDLKYAVDWLCTSGEADPKRIAIYGRSYGGFMVLAAVTTYPDLWAAAIDVVGIVNWITFLENTGPWRRAHREQEYGSLRRDREFLESISPIRMLDRITAPIMVIHGANDPRVPISEADQIVKHLSDRGHPVEYLRYEDEGHKISKIGNRIDSFTKMADFLDRHL